MTVRIRLRQVLTVATVTLTLTVFAVAPPCVLAQNVLDQNREKQNQSQPRERQTTKALDERADDEAPSLGILAGSCPGKAVCVKGTLPFSPAEEAGIEPGDYILSVDGKEVTSPNALKNLIESMSPGAQVTLMVWRQGKEHERKVQLASKADKLPKGHDAWLGVMLASDEKGGVKIDHIVPGSPASESDLEEGDTLVKIKNEDIKDARTFIDKIEEMGPGDELQLTIRRDGEDRPLTIKLGRFSDAPMAFLRQLQPDFDNAFPGGQSGSSPSMQLIDRALDDLRQQIRVLREEIRELKGDKQANPGKKDDVSVLSDGSRMKLVSQIQLQFPQQNYPRQRPNQRFSPYRNYNNFGRYGQTYSPYYGNDLGNTYGGNRHYYRYGGQPYYYGGNSNWYGNRPRSGIQVGPNFGVYWY